MMSIYNNGTFDQCLSVQFSSVVSGSLWPHGLLHTRLPCPSPTPGAFSNSCPSRWCHPTISSSVVPFSTCLQSFPASGSFPMSQFFTSGGQSYWSFSFSISPSNEYSGLFSFRIDWLDLFAVLGTLKRLLQHHNSKASIFQHSAFFIVPLSHPHINTGKTSVSSLGLIYPFSLIKWCIHFSSFCYKANFQHLGKLDEIKNEYV